MPVFLDTRGRSTLGIGICARCSRKFSIEDLSPDPNYPNLMVCKVDSDQYDPYRLAARQEDQITLPFVRPDTPVNTDPAGFITQNGDTFIVTGDDKYIVLGD